MILVKLILAHLIGDFFLQPGSWVENKIKKRWMSPALYAHVLIHILLIFLLFGDIGVWIPALVIGFSHYLIDGLKVSFQKDDNQSFLFGVDQFLHAAVLIFVWIYFWDVTATMVQPDYFLALLTGALFLTMPSSVIMKKAMSRWSNEIDDESSTSLQGAGKYIGMLERLIIYIAILGGSLQVIGFLLAAKSVFRFGDLTRTKDRKLTEYILIGTLLSFLLAIITGLLTVQLLR